MSKVYLLKMKQCLITEKVNEWLFQTTRDVFVHLNSIQRMTAN